MKNHKNIAFALVFIFFACPFAKAQTSGYVHTQFDLLPQSSIELAGTTNINQFNCYALELMPHVNVLIKSESAFVDKGSEKNLTSFTLKDAEVAVAVNLLECGQAAINKDMKKTLNAEEHPEILINLKHILIEQHFNQDYKSVTAEADLVIAGFSKNIRFEVKGEKPEGENFYTIKGEHAIKLTDFGIEPPNTFFGLIKVQDEINIVFDLAFRPSETSKTTEGIFSNTSGADQ